MQTSTVKYIFYGIVLFVCLGLIYTNVAGKKQDAVLKQDYIQYQTALKLHQNNQFEEAINGFEKLIANYPDEYILYYNLGEDYSALRDFEKAADNYQKALNIRPALYQDPNFVFKMGESLYHIKQFDLAKTYLSNPVLEQLQTQRDELLQLIEKENQS